MKLQIIVYVHIQTFLRSNSIKKKKNAVSLMSDPFRDNLPNIFLYEINAFFDYKNGCKRITFYHLATDSGETQTCNCLYTKPLLIAHLFYAFFALTLWRRNYFF